MANRDNGSGKSERGFAAMDSEKQREIASKGGAAVSRNRDHMSAIGRKGGEKVSRDREHMSAIGRKGGEARGDGQSRGEPQRDMDERR